MNIYECGRIDNIWIESCMIYVKPHTGPPLNIIWVLKRHQIHSTQQKKTLIIVKVGDIKIVNMKKAASMFVHQHEHICDIWVGTTELEHDFICTYVLSLQPYAAHNDVADMIFSYCALVHIWLIPNELHSSLIRCSV